MNHWSILALVAIVSAVTYAQAEYRRVCYVSNWAQYRPSPGTFFPNQTDPFLCTHLMFAFAVLNEDNTIKPYEWNDDLPGGLYDQAVALKDKQPNLKVSIAVGGWNFGMEQAVLMMATQANRSAFINSVIPFCRQRGFDGVDVDFEYPGSRGSPASDKYHFTSLLEEFRTAIDSEAASSGKTPLLLTAAVGAGKSTIDAGYEVPLISQHLDFMNIMTYDFNGAWDSITGINSPLYSRADEVGAYYGETERSTLNLDWAARYWVELGAPKEKLTLGIATFGRCFTLEDPTQYGLGAPIVGPCKNGTYTREAGFLSYYEVCQVLNDGATRKYSDEHKAPYAYKGDQWIGYDDEESLLLKVDYIMENGYSGWMVWNVDLDDFSGNLGCKAGPYPLITAANDRLKASPATPDPTTRTTPAPTPASTTTTTTTTTNTPTAPPSTTTTTVAPSTTATPADLTTKPATVSTIQPSSTTYAPFTCDGKPNGNYVNPRDCTSFIICSNEDASVVECSPGLYYNEVIQTCDWPQNLSDERQEECGLN